MPQGLDALLEELIDMSDPSHQGYNMPDYDPNEVQRLKDTYSAMPDVFENRPSDDWTTDRPYEEASMGIGGGLDDVIESYIGLRPKSMARGRSPMQEVDPNETEAYAGSESNMPVVDPQEYMTPSVRGAEDIPPNILRAMYERSV